MNLVCESNYIIDSFINANIACNIIPSKDSINNFCNNLSNKRVPICIITPCYNTKSKYIFELCTSLINQTVKNWQWIIVNDVSNSQDTINCLNKIQNEMNNVIVISQEKNDGPAAARNIGWKYSCAEYLFFIDDDDIIDPTTLEKLYWCLQTEPHIGFANTYVSTFGINNINMVGGYFYGFRFLFQNCTSSCFMIRSDIDIRFSEEEIFKRGCEDWDLWINLASKGIIGHTIKEHLFHYRQKKSHRNWDFNTNQRISYFKTKYSRLYDDPKGYPIAYRDVCLLSHIGYNKITRLTYHDCIYSDNSLIEADYLDNIEKYCYVPPYKFNIGKSIFANLEIDLRCDNIASESHIVEALPSLIPIINIIASTNCECLYIFDKWDPLHIDSVETQICIIVTGGTYHHDKEFPYSDIIKYTQDYHFLYKFLSIHEYDNYINHIIQTRTPKSVKKLCIIPNS